LPYFVVFGEYGSSRVPGKPLGDQPGWQAHADFMDGLADDGLVLLAGPIGAGDSVLLVTSAESREIVEKRLGEDPWRHTAMLLPPRIELWDIRIGTPGGQA
jgi:uncharacterized protein YciI